MKKEKKYLKLMFEVITPLNDVIDEETLKKEYKGNIEKVAKFLYKLEGFWWNEELKLVGAKIISIKKKEKKIFRTPQIKNQL